MLWLTLFGAGALFVALFIAHLRQPTDALAEKRLVAPYRLPNPQNIPTDGAIRFQALGIKFHVLERVHLDVHSVDALLMPTRSDQAVTLDDPESMKVELLSASTSITSEDMTRLLNDYALPQSKLPIHSINISFKDGEVELTGKVHKLIDVPFKAEGTIGVTPHGNFHLHFDKITALGFLHKGLLNLLGLDIADLAKRSDSFHVHGDDVDFPIHILFPAPHFSGRMRSATIEGDRLVQIFGEPQTFPPAPVPVQHYVYLRGGVLDFGRLSMRGVDLELLNKDADETFELSLRDVFDQVLPGYMKNLQDHGMAAYIGTYHDPSGTRAPGTAK